LEVPRQIRTWAFICAAPIMANINNIFFISRVLKKELSQKLSIGLLYRIGSGLFQHLQMGLFDGFLVSKT
jgi:hypothetical protein